MSFIDQKAFLQSIHPFDELSDTLMEELIKRLDIAFYPANSTLDLCKEESQSFFIIIKGAVKVLDENDDIVRVYRERDSFDVEALLEGRCDFRYIVSEDLICYEIDRQSFMRLFEACEGFRRFYLMDLVERIEYLKRLEFNSSSEDWLTARVEQSYLHTPCIVEAKTPLIDAIRQSLQMGRSEIIVRSKEGEYGIIADSDLKRMLAEASFDAQLPVGELAHYPLCSIEKDDFLFNAYLTLISKNFKRLGVTDKGELIAILEQIDILSFFANRSHLLTVRIEKARTIDELKEASQEYLTIVRRLYNQGLKSRYIAKLISEINRKTFAKLFEMIMPPQLQEESVFVVMGSEGRGEQLIRTDQDNALILRNGVDEELFIPYAQRISQALKDFGYPECPGNIMLTNPYWRRDVESFKKEIERWIDEIDEEHFIHFAIFFDALAVAGDEGLLQELREHLFSLFDERNDLYMAFFARLTLRFQTPVGIWSSLLHKDRHFDIKKAGIFPIVHGVRSLALKYRIEARSSVERIKELSRKGVLEQSFAKELVEAFDALSILRLGAQLRSIEEGRQADNMIHSDELSKIQRDLLRDSLEIVERFKGFIARDFELERLPS